MYLSKIWSNRHIILHIRCRCMHTFCIFSLAPHTESFYFSARSHRNFFCNDVFTLFLIAWQNTLHARSNGFCAFICFSRAQQHTKKLRESFSTRSRSYRSKSARKLLAKVNGAWLYKICNGCIQLLSLFLCQVLLCAMYFFLFAIKCWMNSWAAQKYVSV